MILLLIAAAVAVPLFFTEGNPTGTTAIPTEPATSSTAGELCLIRKLMIACRSEMYLVDLTYLSDQYKLGCKNHRYREPANICNDLHSF